MPIWLIYIQKLLCRYVAGFIFSSNRTLSFYSKFIFFNQPKIIIHPPVDTQAFYPSEQFLNKEVVIIGTLCNINPTKDILTFIEMAKILTVKYPNLFFHIAGPIPETQKKYGERVFREINESRLENLRYLGKIEDPATFYSGVDIFVCTSLFESGPMTLFEAMSSGKPVVTTDVGDVVHFLRDGESGFVVHPKDSAFLAEKVGKLIENRKLREKFGEKARDLAVKYLDIDNCIKKHAEFYREMLNAR